MTEKIKQLLIRSLKWLLKQLARLTIWRYRPGIVGITGSVGKTSAKYAVAAVLGSERHVRFAQGNFNNELGLPLTILGDWGEIVGWFFWPKVMFASLARIVIKTDYPEILILEYGVDRPGDMKYLLQIARPNVSIITAVGEVPAHVEFFAGPEEIAREKARIIDCLPAAGHAVLNYDDDTVMALKERTRGHVISFGFQKGATVQITNLENRIAEDRPQGISFKIEYGGSFVPVRLDGVFGLAHAYAAGAATCVGIVFGMNLVTISEALANYKSAPHRMEMFPGLNYTYVLDDAYNASPLSMHAALHVLHDLPGKRKVAILGDMLEIGKYAMDAHEQVGKIAGKTANVLVTVGARAKFIAQGAERAGMPKKSIYIFDSAEDAAGEIQNLIKKGDLILVKASHAMHLEKVVEQLKAF